MSIKLLDRTLARQMRATAHPDAYVRELAALLNAGAAVDAPDVFEDALDGTLRLTDGEGRVRAHESLGHGDIEVRIHSGDRRAALKHALGANMRHGRSLTSAEKRNAVAIALRDREIRTWSDSAIASLCGVTDKTVASVRSDLGGSETPNLMRRGRDGKMYPAKQKRRSDEQHEEHSEQLPPIDLTPVTEAGRNHPEADIPPDATPQRETPDLSAVIAAGAIPNPPEPVVLPVDLGPAGAAATSLTAMLGEITKSIRSGRAVSDQGASDAVVALRELRHRIGAALSALEPFLPARPSDGRDRSVGRLAPGMHVRMTRAAQTTYSGSLSRDDLDDLVVVSVTKSSVSVKGRSGKVAHFADVATFETVSGNSNSADGGAQ